MRDAASRRVMLWAFLLSGTLAAAAAIAMVVFRVPAGQYTIGHGRGHRGTFILTGELAGLSDHLHPGRAMRSRPRPACAHACASSPGPAYYRGRCDRVRADRSRERAGVRTGLTPAAAAFYLATHARVARARYALVPFALAAVAVVAFFNVNHNPSENYTRLSIWQATLEIIERFPLTGVGPFDFATAYAQVRPARRRADRLPRAQLPLDNICRNGTGRRGRGGLGLGGGSRQVDFDPGARRGERPAAPDAARVGGRGGTRRDDGLQGPGSIR